MSGLSIWRTTANQKDGEHVSEVVSSLHQETDRSVAIIGAAIVDNALSASLLRFLHHYEKVSDELFRSAGALGSFSARIHLGLLVGLYGEQAHRDLNTMRAIRNSFAHKLSVTSFKTQSIAALSMNLKLVEKHLADSKLPAHKSDTWQIGSSDREAVLKEPRDRYLATAQIFTLGLSIPNAVGMPAPIF